MSQVSVTGQEAGVELGYAQATADFTTTSTSFTDVTSITTTVTTGTRPVVIYFFTSALSNSAANGGAQVQLMEDGVSIGIVATNLINLASTSTGGFGAIRRAPSAGSHTYKAQAKSIFSGTTTIAATGVAPMYIQVVQA